MLFGSDVFADTPFGTIGEEIELKEWNEICPADSTWTQLPPREVEIARCTDDHSG